MSKYLIVAILPLVLILAGCKGGGGGAVLA